jgi:Na+:H+ antiporter, NhaA family
MPLKALQAFIRHEAFGGMLLLAAAVVALVVANSGLARIYEAFLALKFTVSLGEIFAIDKPLLLWINDGLMAVFFFTVGLEIKRELKEGELSSPARALLPGIAALGGMIVPAGIYAALNWSNPVTLNGWAIPAATDIAFALGVLALLGRRVPLSLKVFLLALAVLDDLGAVVIIAVFYTANLSLAALFVSLAGLAILVALNLRGVAKTAPYLLIGLVVWAALLKSGVHATLAGVAVAFTVPMRDKADPGRSPLGDLLEGLHPSVAYVILPLFAFANAGVSLAGITLASLAEPVPLGIALGLFVGKQVGVFAFTFAAVKAGLCPRPEGARWIEIYGVAILCGIGFTMSLFIGALAFESDAHSAGIRLGVLGGSLVSALAGYALLRAVTRPRAAAEAEP